MVRGLIFRKTDAQLFDLNGMAYAVHERHKLQ